MMEEQFTREAGRERKPSGRGRARGVKAGADCGDAAAALIYGTDAFRIQCFKVLSCSNRTAHEWCVGM
jgi:hypothetical protein